MANAPKKPGTTETPVQSFKKRQKRGSSHGQAQESTMVHDESNWLVSYADMMTLLFGFFVLMYSFSRIDEKKFEIIRKDVARYFGGQVRVNPTIKKIEDEVKDVISQSGLDKNIQLIARDAEIELRFQGTLHFVSGTAELTKDSSFVLAKLIDLIKRNVKADTVSVEGHTDDEPISSKIYPSNWELSANRASTVVREFEKYGFDPAKLTAKGFGSSRPLLPNRDSKGDPIPDNQEINRRVIVTIGFNREVEDAIRAMKTNQFVSADAPELDSDKNKTPLVRDGEGEPTWREKVVRDTQSVQEKLKLAEERLKETEERNRAARNLAEMQNRLQTIEGKIERSEIETKKLVNQVGSLPTDSKSNPDPAVARKPAAITHPARARQVHKVVPKRDELPETDSASPVGAPVGAPVAPTSAVPANNNSPKPASVQQAAPPPIPSNVQVVAPVDIPVTELEQH
ncbi:MAG: OmpA family protein [Bdellovibrionales bacterium]|nr:OmpA family protein [Bdellovibrionales bacterium]